MGGEEEECNNIIIDMLDYNNATIVRYPE